nr:MAG TPA: hypothetical protein [Caudoviricetes sp.]
MPVKIIDGDLFTTKARIIAHQVNCQGVMGSGVAKQIRQRNPQMFLNYARHCAAAKRTGWSPLGTNLILHTDADADSYVPGTMVYTGQYICNMFAQNMYGYDGRRYTNIDALRSCFTKLAQYAREDGLTVAMPYKVGCVRGGANWEVVYKMIEEIFRDVNVELWRLDKG